MIGFQSLQCLKHKFLSLHYGKKSHAHDFGLCVTCCDCIWIESCTITWLHIWLHIKTFNIFLIFLFLVLPCLVSIICVLWLLQSLCSSYGLSDGFSIRKKRTSILRCINCKLNGWLHTFSILFLMLSWVSSVFPAFWVYCTSIFCNFLEKQKVELCCDEWVGEPIAQAVVCSKIDHWM